MGSLEGIVILKTFSPDSSISFKAAISQRIKKFGRFNEMTEEISLRTGWLPFAPAATQIKRNLSKDNSLPSLQVLAQHYGDVKRQTANA